MADDLLPLSSGFPDATEAEWLASVDKVLKADDAALDHAIAENVAPLIVKLLESTQGKGVVLAETKKAAESVIDAFRGLKANFLVQDFVKEAAGEDIRCLVIGGKVVASMKRTGADGDFRSNLHRGGSAKSVRITKAERETAIRAARVFDLDMAGVDLLRSEGGPKVLEVNSSPGFEGIETATGKNLTGLLFEEIERRARPVPKRRRKNAAD